MTSLVFLGGCGGDFTSERETNLRSGSASEHIDLKGGSIRPQCTSSGALCLYNTDLPYQTNPVVGIPVIGRAPTYQSSTGFYEASVTFSQCVGTFRPKGQALAIPDPGVGYALYRVRESVADLTAARTAAYRVDTNIGVSGTAPVSADLPNIAPGTNEWVFVSCFLINQPDQVIEFTSIQLVAPALPTVNQATNLLGTDWKGCATGPGIGVGVSSPHASSVESAEHEAVESLIEDGDITHTAIRSGNWSEASTWLNGVIPGRGARALIATGAVVALSSELTEPLSALRVDGSLTFSSDVDTALVVDTMLVTRGGNLLIGTPAAPISPDKRAKIIIADLGPIDLNRDPLRFGRGLISHGNVCFFGAEKTPFLALANTAAAGATQVTLATTPTNWQVGDQIVLSATEGEGQEDVRTIRAIAGATVGVSALSYRHGLPPTTMTATGFKVYVANVTRNIAIESQTTGDLSRRGHVMFMHNNRVGLNFASFNGLGRTNKRTRVNDPMLDPNGNLESGTGTNPRGRYSVHFHKGGPHREHGASQVNGCAAVGSPGWSFVNHSSFVEMVDNVSYDVAGAHFVTEAGNEIGTFVHNLAMGSHGSGEDTLNRADVQDFAHEGNGFWFQGVGGIEVTRNIAAGHTLGYFMYNQGLKLTSGDPSGINALGQLEKCFLCVHMDAENLVDPAWAAGLDGLQVQSVPLRKFEQNEVYASETGLFIRYFNADVSDPTQRSYIDSLRGWNLNYGIHFGYSGHTSFRNLVLQGAAKASGAGIVIPVESGHGVLVQNPRIERFFSGIEFSPEGNQTVDGGYYRNINNFSFPFARVTNRTIRIGGNLELASFVRDSYSHYDFALGGVAFAPTDVLNPQPIFVDSGPFAGKQLNPAQQADSFVPFPVAALGVDPDWINKSNSQLWTLYHIRVGAAPLPQDAVTDPSIGNGFVGSRVN